MHITIVGIILCMKLREFGFIILGHLLNLYLLFNLDFNLNNLEYMLSIYQINLKWMFL